MNTIRSKSFCGIAKAGFLLPVTVFFLQGRLQAQPKTSLQARERISLNSGWRFMRYSGEPDSLAYDLRPLVTSHNDNIVADTRATDSGKAMAADYVLKAWVLPTANAFINDSTKWYKRPAGNPGQNFPFVQGSFNDASWQQVNLPHDWAINGPFYDGNNPVVGGGMGRLPIQGVAWYRKKITISKADAGNQIYLDIDGAMSYAIVWCNGKLVGGWPYGYNSFRLNLTPYIKFGSSNQLSIRIDNPNYAARWYPGAGIYRNMWLVKTKQVHIAHWGTNITTSNVSEKWARVHLKANIQNNSAGNKAVVIRSSIYEGETGITGKKPIAIYPAASVNVKAGGIQTVDLTAILSQPKLWGPIPQQKPNLYTALTQLFVDNKLVDEYKTVFGIRNIEFDATKGLQVNGQAVKIQGVNQHHDLGALGGAFNTRAVERQLEILGELGCNAIRLSHNPPAPELLELTDRMGFLVIDEVFDCWQKGKTPHDFHLIFNDWHEADIRSFIRRDRNHPSVIAWSFGNEVGEQYTSEDGAKLAKQLYDIVHEEDSTRPATASMNYAKPDMPFSAVMDIISLNYQGEGIRDAPAYAHLKGIRTTPLYPAFQQKFPGKLILSSETASALSTRGTYIFPVTNGISAPVSDSTGGNPKQQMVSAYELYTAAFGASADKVFASQDKHPYVAGEFVWSGWDYIGEPTPYYTARSSYSGIIDLAGFKKDRFYLYQARWRPELPMVHLLPHWNWPNRVGQITPVHLFTSGDEAELFLNGRSLGRKKKAAYEYRLRWDDVVYEPGELKAVAYKNGQPWATETIKTSGQPAKIKLTADRTSITADGKDLCFITATVIDDNGLPVPDAVNSIKFTVEGPAELLATDNGDPASMVSFASPERQAYSGLLLGIVRSNNLQAGAIKITASSPGLQEQRIQITAK